MTFLKVTDSVCNVIADKPHCSNPGRQQEENLYEETTVHVCLRSAHYRLPPYTAAAGHHYISVYNGTT